MKHIPYFALFLLLLSSCDQKESLTDFVDPIIGTAYTGHTFPGAILPFGMVSASPDTDLSDWEHCSGYHYDDSSIMGFSQTHMSGTGANDMCDLLLMPVSGEPKFEPGTAEDPDSGYRSRFSHERESARPGYYSVKLDDYGIDCEVTVTPRCPFYRFTFPKGRQAGVIFDMAHGNDARTASCGVEAVSDRAVKGFRHSNGFVRDHVYHFWAEFSEPVLSSELSGDGSKLYVSFKPGSTVLVKMGVSTVSAEAARANLEAEIGGWDFERTVREADAEWNAQLSKVRADFASDRDKRVFYTAMYHSMIVPNLITDVDGSYRGWDGQEHHSEVDLYTNYSLWDTYRATHPFFNIVCPERNVDFINSMLERYGQIGSLPINEYGTCETYCMIGDHSVPVIADAYLKGLEGFDYEKAFQAVKAALTTLWPKTNWEYYDKYGYFPFDLVPEESVSRTLECCYDDWCAAQMAKGLGYEEDYEFFNRRAQFYKNVFDPAEGLVRGRDTEGNWRTPFDRFYISHAGDAGGDYTEGNAWQYTWHVQHDIPGMIAQFESNEAFTQKLDSLFAIEKAAENSGFSMDVTGMIGQYAHGNEPSHHVAYLYALAGKAWRTHELLREICETQYSDAPDGLCGNDDCGQMSAWYIFTNLGFYPVNPCGGEYILGAPQLPGAVISLNNGNTFTIIAEGISEKAKYVKDIWLNGERYSSRSISYEQLMMGGELIFKMTENKEEAI